MKSHLHALACLTLVAGLGHPGRALADDTHSQPIFAGSRAMGMGTAFTGLANDGSALFHNPAGVLTQRDVLFAGGFWVNAFDTVEIEEGLRTPSGFVPVESTTRPSIPTFGAFLVPFGHRNIHGYHRGAFGLSAFRVRNDDRSFEVTAIEPGAAQHIDVDTRDQINYYGVTLAGATRSMGTRFGFSLFLSQRGMRHREAITSAVGTEVMPGELANATILDLSHRFQLKSFDFVGRLGFMQKLTHSAQLGVMLQTPGIAIRSRGGVFERNILTHEVADTEDIRLSDEGNLPARSPIPMEARVGLGWMPVEWMSLGIDASVTMPMRNRSLLEDDPASLAQGIDDTFLFLDTHTGRRFAWNVAAGVEFMAKEHFLLRLGGLTDRTTARYFGNSPTSYQSPRVHRYGFSASIGFRGHSHGLAFGTVALFGKGRALGVTADPDLGTISYYPTDATARLIVFQLSGSTSPLRMLARGATDTLMGQ